MDQNIINTLKEFLPDEVLNEIAIVNGFKIDLKEIKNGNGDMTQILNETKNDYEKKENEDIEKKVIKELKDDTKEEVIKELKDDTKEEVKKINFENKHLENQNKIENHYSIFDFLSENKNTLSKPEKFNTKTQKREIRYGFIEDEIFKFDYFIFPVSVSKIETLMRLLKEIDEVFKGNDTKNYIPNFLLGEGDDLYNIDEKVNYLMFLVINFINNNGKQLLPQNIIYNNLKLDKITPELLKNSDFYKNFLVQEKSYIKTMSLTLDNPKTRFLKYYLIELSKNIKNNDKNYSKIQLLLNFYLKDIKAKKSNININQYKDLRSILAIIKLILEGEIGIKRQLLNKINDLYEYWLFQKIVKYFNEEEKGKEYLEEKLYYTVNKKDIGLNEIKSKTIKGKIKQNDFIFGNGEFYLKESNFKKEKNKENKNERIKLEIKDILDNSGLNHFQNYNSEKFIIGKGFIKEDSPKFDGLSTIELDNLSKDTRYNISISLGGHNENLENSKILSDDFENLINSKLDHLEEIISSNHITPDFIIKIREKGKIIGSIILDAKFSKYPFFLDKTDKEKTMDYAPVLKYYIELGKNFSTTEKYNNFPYKVIILFPGDKEAIELEKLNDYFQRVSNIVAVPLMIGDENILNKNLKYLEDYIIEFINEIKHKKKTN